MTWIFSRRRRRGGCSEPLCNLRLSKGTAWTGFALRVVSRSSRKEVCFDGFARGRNVLQLRAFWILPEVSSAKRSRPTRHATGIRFGSFTRLPNLLLVGRSSTEAQDRYLTEAKTSSTLFRSEQSFRSEVNLDPHRKRCGYFYAPKYAANSSAVPLNVSRSTCPTIPGHAPMPCCQMR